MVQVARENMPAPSGDKLSFEIMRAESLQYPDSTYGVVLNRQAPVHVGETARVLCHEGTFISEQVGARNSQNPCSRFGRGPGGEHEWDPSEGIVALAGEFRRSGCTAVAQAEYDVGCFFLDVESLVFSLKAVPIPEDFDVEMHWRPVGSVIAMHHTVREVQTNEHRELLIVRKGQQQVVAFLVWVKLTIERCAL
jgi:hypothetical protein